MSASVNRDLVNADVPQSSAGVYRGGQKLAIVTTHPIQYHAPWLQALANHPLLDLEVLYCHKATPREQAESGFGIEFDWDLPLLEGYKHRFLRNVSRKPSVGSFWGLDTPEIRDVIRREQYDAVLINGWHYKSAWQAMQTCWSRKIPVMVRSDSHLYTSRHLLKRLLKEIPYRQFIGKLDACLAVGRWSRDYFLHYGAAPEKVFWVPHVIDPNRFDQEYARSLKQREVLRKKWELEPEVAVFLFVGKFIQKKRPMEFLKAVHEAVKAGARLTGLMIGDGPLRQTCEDFVRQSHTPVRFAGFLNQSQIAQGYIACDALVLPSDGRETWGLVVNEAMSCRRPCIVSDAVGCGPDLVTPGETGFVFPLDDVLSLAKIMARCSANLAQLARMGEIAYDRISRYSVRAAVDGVLTALEKVTNHRSERVQSCRSVW